MIDPHPRKRDDGLIRLCTIMALSAISWAAMILICYGAYIALKSSLNLLGDLMAGFLS